MATSIALTVVVFAAWLLYHFVGRRQRIRVGEAYDYKLREFHEQAFGRSSPLAQEEDWAGEALDDPHFPRSRYPSAELPRDERVDGQW